MAARTVDDDPHTYVDTRSRRWMWLAAWPVAAVLALSNEPAPLYVLWQQRMGFADLTLTLIYAAYVGGLLATLCLAGTLADRFGRRPVLIPGLILATAATALFAAASTVLLLVAARLLTGIAVGVFLSAGLAAVVELAPPGETRVGGLVASASMVGGAALGPLLAGALSETLPYPTVSVFVLQIGLLGAAVPILARLPTRKGMRHTPRAGLAPAVRSWLRLPTAPRANRRELAQCLAVFAPAITLTGFVLALGPSLLARLLHTDSRVVAGGTIFVLFAAATGVQFIVRGLSVRMLLRLGSAATIAGSAALAIAVALASVPLLLTAGMLTGLGQGAVQLGSLSTLAARVPPARLAEATAALTAGGYLLAGALPVTAGYLSDAVGLATGTTIVAITIAGMAFAGVVAATVGQRALR